jgi:gliding motility-associated-like protein
MKIDFCNSHLVLRFCSVMIVLLLLGNNNANGQIATCNTATTISNIGIDSDMNANTAFPNTDDWFLNSLYSGTGIGIIGTSAATAQPPLQISAADFATMLQGASGAVGRNRTYVQRMSVPYLTIHDNMLLLDAFSARDNITSGSAADSTVFSSGGDKNGDNPATWAIGVGGVQQKNDIIDVGGHLRRNLTTNELWGFAYSTILSPSGDGYSDVEIFRTIPAISGGSLANSDASTTGGHSPFKFNSTGAIQEPGDVLVSINYRSSAGVASVRIWINPSNVNGSNQDTAWLNSQPGRPFTFTGDFITGLNANGYGYAEIKSKSEAACLVYSTLNTTNTPAGAWGNLSGSGANYTTTVNPSQLVEIAINFTKFGLDLRTTSGDCFNIFGAVLFKTRSSSSWSSELKDVAGPFTFGNFTEVQANAGTDKIINCNQSQVTLTGGSLTPGATYSWTTIGGNFLTATNIAQPVVDQPGIYILSVVSPTFATCVSRDTVIVVADLVAPTAFAGNDIVIDCNTGPIVAINATASSGTTINWTSLGGGNIVSGLNTVNPTVNAAASYVLTATSTNNGCSSSDTVQVSLFVSTPTFISENVIQPSCNEDCNGSINLNLSTPHNPITYTWSNGATTSSLTGLCAGTYTVSASGTNGCTTSKTYILSTPSALSLTLTPTNVLCYGENTGSISVVVNGGTSPYEYSWSNGATTQNLSGVSSGTNSLTVTDANGCSFSATATITQPTEPLTVITTKADILCRDNTTGSVLSNVNGGTTPYTYSWSNGVSTDNITNLAAGIYTVTITDANNCITSASATLTQPAAILSGSLTPSAVLCNSGNSGSITSAITGGTDSYTYSWSNGATTAGLTSLTAGTYTATVTDNNGCSISLNTTVAEPAAALATSAVTTDILCHANTTGAINLSVTGGTTPYSYYWSNGATTQDISNLASGFYAVTITDKNNCTTTYSGNLSEPAAALAAITSKTNILCRNDLSGEIVSNVTGGTAPYTYLWNNGATAASITGLAAGTYTVSVTDAHNCSTTVISILIQPAQILSGNLTTTAISCNSGNNGAISAAITGGTTPYQYNWSNGSATSGLTGLIAGTYTLTVTDAHGCSLTRTATISQPETPLNATVNSTNVLCHGNTTGSINITVAGGTASYTYAWSNNATSQDLNNIPAGAYQVTITDMKGCTFSAASIITEPAGPLQTVISARAVKCNAGNDGQTSVSATGGTAPYTYLWNNGVTTADNENITAGTYTVTVTDANGCTSVKCTAVTQPVAALTLSETHQNLSCFSQPQGSVNLTVNGGTAPYSYNWSNGLMQQNISGLPAGVYTVTVTDKNGCSETISATVTQPPGELNVTATLDHVNCHAGNDGQISVSLSMGTPPYAIQWSTGATTSSITNLTSGLYTVSVSDANGCNLEIVSFVQQPNAALTASDSITPVYCFGDASGAIYTTVYGGTLPYTYSWSNGSSTSEITNLTAGTYTVILTDAQACTLNETYVVSQPAGALTITSNVTQPNCVNVNDGNIDLSITGGTAPYAILWSSGETTEDLSNLAPGTYTIIVTDAVNCTATDTYTINFTAPLLTVSGNSTAVLCHGDSNGALNITAVGGTLPYSYAWSNGATSANISQLTTGNYSVIVTDVKGCTASYSNLVPEPAAALAVTETHTAVACFGNSTGLIDLTVTNGTPGYTFLWSDGNTDEDRVNLTTGTYLVTVTDANGCSFPLNVNIQQPAAPLAVNSTLTNILCNSNSTGAIQLTTSGGTTPYTYSWSNGSTNSGIQNLIAGQYSVIVTDGNNCTFQDSYTLTEPSAAISMSATTQQVSCTGISNGSITLTVNGGTPAYTYLWSNGATTPDLTALPAASYIVTVTDANNCSATQSINLSQPLEVLAVTGNIKDANCIYGILGNVVISPTGGTQPYSFYWSNGNSSQNLNNVLPGSYLVTVTDANGCSTGQEFLIADLSTLSVQADGNSTICVGNMVTISAQFSQPVTAGLQWHYNGAPLIGANTATFTTPVAGTYTLVASTACGSYTSNSIEVSVRSLNSVMISSEAIICPGESVQLTAGGGVEYSWSPGAGLSDSTTANPVANPTTTTEYSVLVKDDFGCTARASVIINVVCDTLDIPNGFSSNEDGTNDTFVIDGLSKYPVNMLWIYNRWGNLVYKKQNYDNTWDGRSNVSGVVMGQELPNGTYYCLLDLKLDKKPFKGFVVIRR